MTKKVECIHQKNLNYIHIYLNVKKFPHLIQIIVYLPKLTCGHREIVTF
jgi:hypothetical protein